MINTTHRGCRASLPQRDGSPANKSIVHHCSTREPNMSCSIKKVENAEENKKFDKKNTPKQNKKTPQQNLTGRRYTLSATSEKPRLAGA
jgi:hypothetical protein